MSEQPEVADAYEPERQNVQEEAPQELVHVERHLSLLVVVPGIAPAERHAMIFQRQQPVTGNGHTMRVAGRGNARTCSAPPNGRLAYTTQSVP